MAAIPAPPKGFTIDEDIPPPPKGFSVDEEIPPPPAGFTVDGQESGLLSKIGGAAMWAITPIPAIQGFKDKLSDIAGTSMAAARPGVLASPETADPISQALGAVRSSSVPLPSPDLAKGIVQTSLPAAPLDLVATMASPAIGALRKLLGARVAETVVPKIAQMTEPEITGHLEELARASQAKNKSGEPIIKVIRGSNPRETAANIMDRAARPRLKAEEAIQGLGQVDKSLHALNEEIASKIRMKQPLKPWEAGQFTDYLVESVKAGDLDATQAAYMLGQPHLVDEFDRVMKVAGPETQAQFAKNLRTISSQLGFGLGQIGQMAKKFEKALGPEARAALDKINPPVAGWAGVWQSFNNVMRYVEAFRKSNVVSALGLSMRDMFQHGLRYSLNGVEDAMNGVIAAATGKIPAKDMFKAASQDAMSLIHELAGRGKAADVERLFDKFPMQAQMLSGTPYLEITMAGRFSKWLNSVHNASFTIFNKAALDGFLRNRSRALGVGVEELGVQDLKQGIEWAHKLTFSKRPTGEVPKMILRAYREWPWLSAVAQTFPRVWMNLVESLYDFSTIPTAMYASEIAAGKLGKLAGVKTLEQFGSSALKDLAHVDPKVAYGAISRGMMGAGILSVGAYLGKNGYNEGKWYDIKIKDLENGKQRVLDLRRFRGPTDLLIVGSVFGRSFDTYHGAVSRGVSRTEAINQALWPITKIHPSEWVEILAAFKRTELSGIPVVDAIYGSRGEGVKRAADAVLTFVGSYLQSFEPTMLTRTPKDIIGQFSQEERLPRFVRDRQIVGPLIQNIPFASRYLPLRYSPLRSDGQLTELHPFGGPGVEEVDNPALQQLTGAITRVKTPAELEADRLGLGFKDIYPNTGLKGFDNLITMYMGPMAERMIGQMMGSPEYLKLDNKTKKLLFKRLVSNIRSGNTAPAMKHLAPHDRLEQMAKHADAFSKMNLEKWVDSIAEPQESP